MPTLSAITTKKYYCFKPTLAQAPQRYTADRFFEMVRVRKQVNKIFVVVDEIDCI